MYLGSVIRPKTILYGFIFQKVVANQLSAKVAMTPFYKLPKDNISVSFLTNRFFAPFLFCSLNVLRMKAITKEVVWSTCINLNSKTVWLPLIELQNYLAKLNNVPQKHQGRRTKSGQQKFSFFPGFQLALLLVIAALRLKFVWENKKRMKTSGMNKNDWWAITEYAHHFKLLQCLSFLVTFWGDMCGLQVIQVHSLQSIFRFTASRNRFPSE